MKVFDEKLTSSLIRIRDSKGFTQSYIADRLGISQKAYCYIEAGKCRMELFRFLNISHIFETHPMEILDKVISDEASWKRSIEICFNQKDCRLQKEVENLRTENKLLKAALDRFLSPDKL